METAEFAICIEHTPGELKAIVCGDIRTSQIPGLLMSVARVNDTIGILRVVINGFLVKRLDISRERYAILGVPTHS